MPLDGTNVLDETGLVILKAKEVLLKNGWCVGVRVDGHGRRCALGALDAVWGLGERDYQPMEKHHPAVERLAALVPPGPHVKMDGAAHTVASFNNAQTDPQVIYDWFDRAAYSSL